MQNQKSTIYLCGFPPFLSCLFHESMSFSFPDYNAFAAALQATCRISDPWVEGKPRFCAEPALVPASLYRRLCEAAERIGALYDELCSIVEREPALLDFFSLTPFERLMWFASGGAWHGIARLDLFELRAGEIVMCEMNSDTPSGEAEATLLNEFFAASFAAEYNPNRNFPARFVEMVRSFAALDDKSFAGDNIGDNSFLSARAGGGKCVGIIFPTEIPEDLSMILCYEEWLKNAGFEVVMGAPYNLHVLPNGNVGLFGRRVDIILRHYKTDWWAERESPWKDGIPFADEEPLAREIGILIEALCAGRVQIVNPLGATLTQNKLTMAFFWSEMERFSAESQETVRQYVPYTLRLRDAAAAEGLDKNEWTLKSDYGCEGDEVIIGRAVSEDIWRQSLEQAIPERWVLQRFFDARPTKDDLIPNYGVYLVGGRAAGIYTRFAPAQTDYRALSAATFLYPDASD
jgi:glutathionylspermidine synthase